MNYKVFRRISELPRKDRVTIVYAIEKRENSSVDIDSFVVSDYQRSGGIYSEDYFQVGECDDRLLKVLHSTKKVWVEQKVESAFLSVYEDALLYARAGGNPKIIREFKKKNKK